MDTEPTMTEAEWTEFGWAMRMPPEPELLPITIGYIQPGCYPSDAQ